MCPETCKGCNNVNGSCDKGCHPGWRGDHCKIGRLTQCIATTHLRVSAILMVCMITNVSNVIISVHLIEFNSNLVKIEITTQVFVFIPLWFWFDFETFHTMHNSLLLWFFSFFFLCLFNIVLLRVLVKLTIYLVQIYYWMINRNMPILKLVLIRKQRIMLRK